MNTDPKEAVMPLSMGEAVLKWPARITTAEVEDIRDWLLVIVRRVDRTAESYEEGVNAERPK